MFVAPSLDETNWLRVKDFEIANPTRANAKVFSLQVNSNSSYHGYQREIEKKTYLVRKLETSLVLLLAFNSTTIDFNQLKDITISLMVGIMHIDSAVQCHDECH